MTKKRYCRIAGITTDCNRSSAGASEPTPPDVEVATLDIKI
jgi:hypothetical protein